PSISFPGSTGGGSNSGSAFDPARGMVYATARNVATIGQLSAMLSSDVLPSFGKTKMPFEYYLDHDGYPCNAPPWAELFGINANTGDIDAEQFGPCRRVARIAVQNGVIDRKSTRLNSSHV